MLETVKQMETGKQQTNQFKYLCIDLKMRVKTYGKDSIQAIENMQVYVKTCNEYALHCIKINEFRVAMELLLQCEELLLSGVAGNYPYLKFQTFNNIAHANNVQGNVRLSLKYLLRSLEYGIQSQTQNADQPQAPIVETYINICNAYQFLGLLEKAVEFSDLAIGHSQQVLSQLMQAIEDPNLHQNDRDEFGKQYHSQVNLHAMSFQVKGQILEKQKLFDKAIEEYLTGKQIIEANYGTTHKMYVEFANAINGAKLRTKYFLHSNLPEGYNNMDLSDSKSSLNIIPSQTHNNNLFMREQDMMKPVGQQAAKKKRLRPNSASGHINIQQMKKTNSNHNIMNNSSFQSISSIQNQPYDQSQRSVKKIPRPNIRAIPMQSPQFSTRSSSSSAKRFALGKKQSKSKKKSKIMIQKGVLVTEDGQYADMNQYSSRVRLNHSHNASMQCNDCHSQMAEMRKLHKEQNEMIQQLIKSQSQSQQNFAQTSQMSQQPQISPGQTLQGFNTLQNFNPQPQQMQQQPFMTQPQMYYQQPPQPYYAPPPYYMYPPPMYGMQQPQQPQPSFFQTRSGGFYPPPPMMNNFQGGPQLGASQRSSPDKEFEFMAQHNPDLAWEQFRKEQQTQQQNNNFNHPSLPKLAPIRGYINEPSQTQYSDINDRESLNDTPGRIPQQKNEIIKSNQAYSDNIYIQKQSEQVPKKKKNSYEQEGILNIQVQDKDKNKVKEEPDHQNHFERLQQAAIKIQTYFRRHATMQKFQILLSSMKTKEIFCRSIYLYKNGKVTKRVQIIASLTSVKKKNSKGSTKSVPSHITFQFYDIYLKKVVYESTHKLDQFGVKRPEDLHKIELFNKIKALLQQMQMTGNPEKDITQAIKEKYSQSFKEKDSKIQFVDPPYFEGGFDEVKKVKFTQPKQVVQQTYALEESDKDIDESIQDDYEDDHVEEVQEQIVEKGALNHIIEYEHQVTASFNPIKGEPALVEMRSQLFDKEKVREAGYDMTKEKLNKFMTFHDQKSVELKKMKTKIVEAEKESSFDDSFKEEIIEEEQDHKSSSKSSRKSSKSKDKQDKKIQKNSVLAATIRIQAQCRGMLVRQNAHIYKLIKLNELVCQTLLTQEQDLVFLIKVHKNYDKKKQEFYRFVVNLKSNKECPCFITPISKLPVDITILKEYIQQSVVIQYDRKQNKIIDIKFNEFKEIKQSITIDSQAPTIQQNDQKDYVQDLNQAMNQVELSAIKLQAGIRGFLARKQLEYMKKSHQICTFALSEGKMFANVKVKHGKDKKSKQNDKLDQLKLVISNMSNKKQDNIKMEVKLKVPTEAAQMKEYLQQVLEIKWKGDKIDKASLNEDMSSQKKDKSIKMEENKAVEISKEEVKVVVEEKKIEQVPEKKKDIAEEPKKEVIPEKKQEAIPEKKIEVIAEKPVVEVKKPIEKSKVVDDPKLQEGVILYKNKENPKLLQLIKIQARVRGLLARNSYSTVIIEGFQMLMRMCRRLSDGKLYYVFLMRKNISQIKSMQEAFYFVTLREFTNIKEVYDLEISLDLAKNIFGKKDSTKAELQKLIMFDTNKEEFIKMLNCLDIKNSDDFTLDFAKFKKMKGEEQSIMFQDTHQASQSFEGFKDSINKAPEEQKISNIPPQKVNTSAQKKTKKAQDSDSYGEEEEDDEDQADMEEEYVDEYYDENEDEDKDGVIEEADSKFEVSPQPIPRAMSGGPPSEQKPITPYVVTKKDPAN